MGCDIHFHVEYRRRGKGDVWYHSAANKFSYRDYDMFAALANVRNYGNIKPLKVKGIPNNVSFLTFHDYGLWEKDAFSYSWCTSDELNDCISEVRRKGDNDPVEFVAILAYMKAFEDAGYDTRAVFWFDD